MDNDSAAPSGELVDLPSADYIRLFDRAGQPIHLMTHLLIAEGIAATRIIRAAPRPVACRFNAAPSRKKANRAVIDALRTITGILSALYLHDAEALYDFSIKRLSSVYRPVQQQPEAPHE